MHVVPEQWHYLDMDNAIKAGQTIQFSSQCKAANGTWRAYNIQGDMVRLGRVGARGQMLTPNAANLLSLPAALIAEAVTVGTAVLA